MKSYGTHISTNLPYRSKLATSVIVECTPKPSLEKITNLTFSSNNHRVPGFWSFFNFYTSQSIAKMYLKTSYGFRVTREYKALFGIGRLVRARGGRVPTAPQQWHRWADFEVHVISDARGFFDLE